ncbi:MAG: Smr/MutS family protein [Bdellovibrionales bacterium]|nr:Smr/MutS family protein [Bdellovibrionales bacterium]
MNASPSLSGAALDWEKLLEYASEEARTEPGLERIEALFEPENWAASPAAAQLLQAETQEAIGLLEREHLWGPLLDLASPAEHLEALAKGSVLAPAQLAHLRRWLFAIDAWLSTDRETISGELFRKALSALGFLIDPREPLKTLDRILTSDGELSENASPKLAQIHQEIRELKRQITTQMERIVQKYSQAGALQDAISDVHDGRYVIPVKMNEQSEVEGIIFGTSSTRQTVFIEPSEISPLNNRLRTKQNELAQESWEILDRVSRTLRPYSDRIEGAVEIVAQWDATAAKARLGLVYEGKTLLVGEGAQFVLRRSANPLLWWAMPADRIARNDLDWGEPVRTLLLTGPNTGGKTVLLKTLGLAGICARTGFPFPGEEGQLVPFFDEFFVDVGDSQSIENHLSSFSGHIARFKQILDRVTSQSLVLLDELNSATDPTEGAALGRAFLETVMARGAMIVGTTHDPQLKALALNDDRILNASMAFDEKSKAPSFTLLFGVPGRSRALETAERLGMPKDVLDLARSYLTSEHNKFENMLARLERDANELEGARREANRLRDEAERLKREWTERTERNVSDLLERTRGKLRHILDAAQDEVRAKVRKLEEARSRKDIDSTRGTLNDAFSEAADRIESALREEAPDIAATLAAAKPERATGKEFLAGETVRVPKFKNLAQVLEVAGSKVKIQMGALQMTVTVDDLEKANEAETKAAGAKAPKPGAKRTTLLDRPDAPDERIDLRGKRFDEAMSELEAYLDVAYRSGARGMVTIVHGVGTGAIRDGTRALLKRLPYIKDYRDGGAGGGGAGATLVEFEES